MIRQKKYDRNLMDLLNLFQDDLSEEDILSARILGKLSSAIAKKRIDMQMTQKDFANYLNVSQSMVSKWEGADYNYSIKTLSHLATKLKLKLDVRLDEKSESENLQKVAPYTQSTSKTTIFNEDSNTKYINLIINQRPFNAYSSTSYKQAIGG